MKRSPEGNAPEQGRALIRLLGDPGARMAYAGRFSSIRLPSASASPRIRPPPYGFVQRTQIGLRQP